MQEEISRLNAEVEAARQRVERERGGFWGMIKGVAGGAVTGFILGGPVGAVIGAGIGAAEVAD